VRRVGPRPAGMLDEAGRAGQQPREREPYDPADHHADVEELVVEDLRIHVPSTIARLPLAVNIRRPTDPISTTTIAEPLMKPEILQIVPMLAEVEAALGSAYRVHRYWEAPDRAVLLAGVGEGIRAVATDGHAGVPADVMAACPNLAMAASYGVGYDAIDIPACKARGIRVSNTPDVLNDAVAEITIGLMIGLCRRIPQADAYVREGRWPSGTFGLTGELTGAHAGILGLGRIGKEIARRLQAMKMRVSYHGRREQRHEPHAYYADLEQMARDVDWLVVIAPGSAETKGIVSRRVLEALGPDGALVNVARGSLIDEAAMVELLADGRLGGAALDVFVDEPRVPEALFTMPNVVLSPHQGSATHKTRAAMGDLVVRNLAAFFADDPLVTPVA
jgi:lactate dehydrogenase-like 2-hydroxyacid dehydrogenase